MVRAFSPAVEDFERGSVRVNADAGCVLKPIGHRYILQRCFFGFRHSETAEQRFAVAMDDKLHSELAALVIALFMKGFESEFRKEIFGGIPLHSELALEITDVASMPDDIKAPVVEALRESPCQASRPVQIELDDGKMPTYIFLAGDIFSDMKVGEGKGGASPDTGWVGCHRGCTPSARGIH